MARHQPSRNTQAKAPHTQNQHNINPSNVTQNQLHLHRRQPFEALINHSLEMTAMWKPGTAKPQQQHQSSSSTTDAREQHDTNQKQPAKKLSTSTMGMRFMQRNNKPVDKLSSSSTKSSILSNKNVTQGIHNHTDSNNNSSAVLHHSNHKKRDLSTTSSNTQTTLLSAATTIDMYGPSSDIIGRRSFGGFHPSIATTYNAALQKRMDGTVSKKKKMDDEELLRRYEVYVKRGREKSGLMDDSKRKRKIAG